MGQDLSALRDGQSTQSRSPELTCTSPSCCVPPRCENATAILAGPLPTSAVLDGQGDDNDAEHQGQEDGDDAEHQLQLAARGQAAQQRPRPLPKPHLGRSRTCHCTAEGPNLTPPASPSPLPCLAQLHDDVQHDEVGTRASPRGSPGHQPQQAGSGCW